MHFIGKSKNFSVVLGGLYQMHSWFIVWASLHILLHVILETVCWSGQAQASDPVIGHAFDLLIAQVPSAGEPMSGELACLPQALASHLESCAGHGCASPFCSLHPWPRIVIFFIWDWDQHAGEQWAAQASVCFPTCGCETLTVWGSEKQKILLKIAYSGIVGGMLAHCHLLRY